MDRANLENGKSDAAFGAGKMIRNQLGPETTGLLRPNGASVGRPHHAVFYCYASHCQRCEDMPVGHKAFRLWNDHFRHGTNHGQFLAASLIGFEVTDLCQSRNAAFNCARLSRLADSLEASASIAPTRIWRWRATLLFGFGVPFFAHGRTGRQFRQVHAWFETVIVPSFDIAWN